MKSIIFIAPPAAGKGTQSALVSEKYHIPHISTGDLLRAASRENNERGKYIKEQMETGGLVSDDVTTGLLKERLQESDCDNGYILDGFPRNVEQAKAYEQILDDLHKEMGYVIFLDIDKEIAKKRIVGRLSCSKCGAVYNSMDSHLKPRVDGICDRCFGILSQRADDTEEIFNKRFDTYLKETEPLIAYYEEKGVLTRIDSGFGKEKTFSQIERLLRGSL